VIVPALLHWRYNQADPGFVPFLVLLHLGTAAALVILYRRDWALIVRGFVRAAVRGRVEEAEERLAMLLVVGTVPAGAVGLVLEKPLKSLFANPRTAAAFLLVNGAILLGAELLRRRSERQDAGREAQEEAFRRVEDLSYPAAILVGLAQALALLPGISHSGATMAGGLLAGLRHQEAARFAFLLATPIIGAAAILKLPDLAGKQGNGVRGPALVGALCAAVTAYFAVRFLMRYFETQTLLPFAIYCAAAGTAAAVYFAVT
jgi:undecaprenyl-diphosphatase